jgi:hypothetical protein
MKFKKFLTALAEETTSGDIASVDTKLDLVKRKDKHLTKGKRCKEHKLLNCEECTASKYHDRVDRFE